MEPLRIHLFGGFLLERNGVALPPVASRAGRSLLAYLVTHRGRPIQRDLLAGSFWPELPEGRAKRRLSHSLWQIQDVVSEGSTSHLAVTPDTLTFDTSIPYWLDVEEFDRLFEQTQMIRRGASPATSADAASLRACVELYRGDFMAGFFDDWVIADQDHYRQRYLTALGRLVDVTKAGGGYEEALAYARRLTHHDPLNEEAHQEVMRLCFLLGRTSDAVQQYERVRSVLAEELATEPSPSTEELYQRVIRQRRSGMRPVAGEERTALLGSRSHPPFVGREEERRRILDHLERVLAGPGGVVLVEGEPGVGKTRLAVEAVEDAEWRGFEVSWGSCAPGAIRPFAPLVQVLESLSPLRAEQLAEQVPEVWLGEALRLAPELRKRMPAEAVSTGLRPTEESTRMLEGVVNTLAALGEIVPHLVILDDVHWADRDTLGVLTQLGARLASTRILLLLLYRSEEGRGDPEVWDVLRDLDRVAGLGRVVLSPLSVFELGDMVKRVLGLGRIEPSVASALHRHTGGNVLFALETLLELRDQGLFEGGDDPASVLDRRLSQDAAPLAPRVRSVIDARMSLLRDEVASVFQVAAVCGDPVDLPLLAAAAELPRRSVLDSVDELLHRGLVREESDGTFRVSHDQIRQVVYDGLGHEARRALHRRIGEVMIELRPDQIEAIGHHLLQGRVPDPAARYLLEAGRRAIAINAYATARHQLEAARGEAVRAGWTDIDLYRLLADLEEVLGVLGLRAEQAEVIAEMGALSGTRPDLEAGLERRRAWLLAHTGDFPGAVRSAERAAELDRGRGDVVGLASSLVALGTCLRWSGRPLEAVEPLQAAVDAAGDDQERRAEALTELGSTLVEVQRTGEALPRLQTALGIYRRLGDLRGEAEVTGILARAMRHIGDTDEATRLYDRAIEVCRRIGYRHGEGVNLVNRSNLLYLTRRVGEALTGYDAAASLFAELGNQRGEAMVLSNSASIRHAFLGDDERAWMDSNAAQALFGASGDHLGIAQCLEIKAGILEREGRLAEARAVLEESLEGLGHSGDRSLLAQHLRSLALLHVQSGAFEDALVVAERGLRVCDEADLEELSVEIASIRGLALMHLGKIAAAMKLMSSVIRRLPPGVERPYLIHLRHAWIAESASEQRLAMAAVTTAHRLLQEALNGLSEQVQRLAEERVPEHVAILEMYARYSPRVSRVRLAARDTPLGRPIRDDDLIAVTWTVEHPEDGDTESLVARRRSRILRLAREAEGQGACPSIDDLAQALGVSGATVRRDLAALASDGHPVETRGRRHAS